MLPIDSLERSAEVQTLAAGTPVLRRAVAIGEVLHVDTGRVALGLMEGDVLVHQLGVVEGPFWLEATAAVLGLPSAVDGVAETAVTLRRVPLSAFQASLNSLPASALAFSPMCRRPARNSSNRIPGASRTHRLTLITKKAINYIRNSMYSSRTASMI